MTKRTNPGSRRQAIPDYLNSGGEATSAEVAKAVGLEKRTTLVYLRDMRLDKEIRSEERQVGRMIMTFHTALTQRTEYSVPEVKPASSTPWRTVNLGTQKEHPIPNQGGQGSLRRTVTVGAAAVYSS